MTVWRSGMGYAPLRKIGRGGFERVCDLLEGSGAVARTFPDVRRGAPER
jgi:hypothetical protein